MAKVEGEVAWKDLEIGLIMDEPGSATQYHTGDWKSQRPIFDKEKCNIKCSLCYIFCPDVCIDRGADGYYVADLDYCKGCGICANECYRKAITMVEEEE